MRIIRSLAAAVLVAAASCGGSGDVASVTGTTGNTSGGNPSGGNTNPPTPTNAVTVSNNVFTPANIQVGVGTTVTWTWAAGSDTHNVTFSDGGSGDRDAGSTFSKTFQTPGTFAYSCTLHPGMNGTVLVK